MTRATVYRHMIDYGEDLHWTPPAGAVVFFVWLKFTADNTAMRWWRVAGWDIANDLLLDVTGHPRRRRNITHRCRGCARLGGHGGAVRRIRFTDYPNLDARRPGPGLHPQRLFAAGTHLQSTSTPSLPRSARF